MSNLKIENLRANSTLDCEAMELIDGGWGWPKFIKSSYRALKRAAGHTGRSILSRLFPYW